MVDNSSHQLAEILARIIRIETRLAKLMLAQGIDPQTGDAIVSTPIKVKTRKLPSFFSKD